MGNNRSHATTALRLILLFLLMILFMVIATIIQTAWLGPSLPIEIPLKPSIRWAQMINTILTFCCPALIWAIVERGATPNPLATNLPSPTAWLLYGLGVGICMVMPNTILTELNASIPQPEWAAAIDQRLQKASEAFLSVNTLSGFLSNVLVIAVTPAICEELFFRGALQRGLLRLTRNPHLAIWIGAAIFSLIHFQLSGSIPRIVLGAALGYLAYYSRSVWPAVIMHFTNNFIAVTLSAIAFRNGNINQFDHPSSRIAWIVGLLSLALICLFFIKANQLQKAKAQ